MDLNALTDISLQTKTVLAVDSEMKILRGLSDEALHLSAQASSEREREATLNVLRHLSEVERRRLYSKFKCDSLFSYCVSELKMSEAHAGRRVNASRLLRDIPTIEEKLRDGRLSLTVASQAQSFFKLEARGGHEVQLTKKIELVESLEGVSTRKADQILIAHSTRPEIHLKETVRVKTETITELKILADPEFMEDLNRLKEVWSHAESGASYTALLKKAVKLALKQCDPKLKAERAEDRRNKKVTPAPELILDPASNSVANPLSNTDSASNAEDAIAGAAKSRTRSIPAKVKHAVYQRDQGCCTFADPATGQTCGSRHFIEYDHIKPYARGGESTLDNLRLRCRAHNQRHAIEEFGDGVRRFYSS